MSGSRMTRVSAAALLAVSALALGGCGGGDDAADAPTTAGTAPRPAAAPAAFDPDPALIALSDLPTGWAVDPDEPEPGGDFCGLGNGVRAEFREGGADVAFALYAEGGDAPKLGHAVGAFGPGGAAKTFREFEAAMTDCPPLESEGVTYEPTAVSFPALGDESVAMLASGEPQGFDVTFYYVAVRVRDGIAVVGYGGLAPDAAEVEKYARLATRKLREVQEESP